MLIQILIGFLFAKSKFRTQPCWCLVVVSLVLCSMVERSWSICSVNCYRGVCGSDGECDCDEGWTGVNCDHCGGRSLLDSVTGTIYDSEGYYNTDSTCVWLVDGGKPGASISLYLEAFATECSWDHLYVFDGDSIYAPQVAAFSGPVRYSDVDIIHEVTTTSGYAFLYFYSDAAFKFEGFNVTYRVNSCPLGCSGHGVCNPTYQNCSCDPLWTGKGCDVLACPSNCSGNGECSTSQKICVCQSGYKGSDCSVVAEEGYWQIEEGKAYGRASAAIVQQDNLIWVIGGYEFNNKNNISIVRHDLDNKSSQDILQLGDIPQTRYGHTAVLYQDEIYVYGGSQHGKRVTDELLIFNVTSSSWASNITYDGVPIAVEGHTALVYEDTMVVMFGYSPRYSYISAVQEYDFRNKTWTLAKTTGAQVIGTYGHSSAFDPVRNMVYIHAGFVDTSKQTDLTDTLYQYDLAKKEWRVLPSSNQPRFLHSAVILNDIMFVFGGNTHTDSVQYTGAKCFSNDFLAYQISCQSWSTVPLESALAKDMARYGHAAFVYDDRMFVYSGFTGVMQEDILIYNPGNCSARINATFCHEITPGLSCQWDVAGNRCILSDEENQYGLVPGNSSLQKCPLAHPGPQCNAVNCYDCQLKPGCGWCDRKCRDLSECDNQDDIFCPGTVCRPFQNCRACNAQEDCKWHGNQCENHTGGSKGSCPIACEAFASCHLCLGMNSCMWCSNQQRCIDSNSYITSFPYGLCWEWHTNIQNCPVTNCSLHKTCEDCHEDPRCGWCDSGKMNGLGTCKEGSLAGPLKIDKASNSALDMSLCPAESWFFFDCPSCQCNGHSWCVNETTSICENCQNNTTGSQCESCADGYYGDALNGGSCSPCQCNNHGTLCDNFEGKCFCNTKGITGTYCDRCDFDQNYYGNPLHKGTCYYKLSMNYEYTFNLSSNDDIYLTMINLMTSPEVNNRDIEFILHISKDINMNITYRSNDLPGIEGGVVYKSNIHYFSTSLSSSAYNFNSEANTTFFVYISNFTVPLSFKITFYQRSFDLVTVLVSFFVCFFVIILLFLTFLKLKDYWDRHRRRRNRAVELAVMARRPFATVNLVIENTVPPDIVAGTKKKQPLAFATANCSDNKAQVATIFMQIPMPDGDKVPFGQTRFSLASALVQAKAKKGERRNSQQKADIREPVRSETNLNNSCTSPIPPQANHEPSDIDRRDLFEDQSRPELHVIQNHFPASYDNAAMV